MGSSDIQAQINALIDNEVRLRDALEELIQAAQAYILAPQIAQRENRLRAAIEAAKGEVGDE